MVQKHLPKCFGSGMRSTFTLDGREKMFLKKDNTSQRTASCRISSAFALPPVFFFFFFFFFFLFDMKNTTATRVLLFEQKIAPHISKCGSLSSVPFQCSFFFLFFFFFVVVVFVFFSSLFFFFFFFFRSVVFSCSPPPRFPPSCCQLT